MPPSPEKSLVTSPGEGRGWKVPATTPLSFLDDSGRCMCSVSLVPRLPKSLGTSLCEVTLSTDI